MKQRLLQQFCFIIFIFTMHCSSDSYLREFDAHLKNGRFTAALKVLNEAPAADSLNPEYLLARIEYAVNAPGAYAYRQVLPLERRLVNTANPILKTLRTKIYSDENMLLRFHLVRVLNALEYPDARWQKIYEQIMISNLQGAHKDVRMEAIRAVAQIPRENSDGLVLLLGALLADSDEAIKLTAASALQKYLNVSTGKHIAVKALQSTDDIMVMHALMMLAPYAKDKQLRSNILPLTSHKNTVIAIAAGAILDDKSHKTDMSLYSIALGLSEPGRIAAVLELTEFVTEHGISAVQLGEFMGHVNPIVRQAAVNAADNYPAELMIPTLLGRFSTEKDIQCRTAIIEMLGQLRAEEAVPQLISAFKSDINRIRQSAILALGNIGASVVPAVIDSLASSDAAVRRHSLIFLSYARDKRASEPVFNAFMADDTEFAMLAAQALISLNDSSLVDTLCVVSNGPDDARALKAIQILGELGDRRALKTLAGIQTPKDRTFQAMAAIRKIEKQNAAAANNQDGN